MKRVSICFAFAMLTLGLGTSIYAICITPEQLQKAASNMAKDQQHQGDESLTFVKAILALVGVTIAKDDIATAFSDGDSWQTLDPKQKNADYKHSDTDWARLVLKRAEFWASDGEIVVAVTSRLQDKKPVYDVALLVPTPKANQADAAIPAVWEGFTIPYAAHSSGKGTQPTAADRLSTIFEGAPPTSFTFYRYKN